MTKRRSVHALVILGGLLAALAAEAGSITMEALYPQVGLVTQRHLPFRLKGDGLAAGGVGEVSLEGAHRDDCRVIRDPYRFDLLILLCKRPADALMVVADVNDGSSRRRLKFGPFKVGTAKVIDDPGPGPDDPPPITGEELFANNCTGCHHTVPNLKSRNITVNMIKNGILVQSVMNGISLTDAQLQLIVDYVKK